MPVKNPEIPIKNQFQVSKKIPLRFIIAIGVFDDMLESLQPFLLQLSKKTKNAAVLVALQPGVNYDNNRLHLSKGGHFSQTIPATGNMLLESNSIYLAPPGNNMSVKKGRIFLHPQKLEEQPAAGIDQLFKSVAAAARQGSIGIIFSSNVTDGAAGLKWIKNTGGMAYFINPAGKLRSEALSGNDETAGEIPELPFKKIVAAVGNFIRQQPTLTQAILNEKSFKGNNTRAFSLKGNIKSPYPASGKLPLSIEAFKKDYARLVAENRELKEKEMKWRGLEQVPAASHEKYKSLFDLSSNAFFICRPHGQILEANTAACDMFGYPGKELLE